MSLYSLKKGGGVAVQPISFDWLPGASMANLFNLYPSRGDFTSTGPITIPTVQDGPLQVVRFGALNLNHVLTTSNRNRGLVLLCDSFTGSATGGITMTAKGAAGQSWWPWYNLTVPQKIAIASHYMSQREIMQHFADNGYFIGDPVIWTQAMMMGWVGLPGVTGTLTEGVKILDAGKCGAEKAGGSTSGVQYNAIHGTNGNVGIQGTGSGGSGGAINIGVSHPMVAGNGKRGCPWGGGPGAGGQNWYFSPEGSSPADNYGGRGGAGVAGSCGGGAGNPGGIGGGNGGDGTGGVLLVICTGSITLSTGFVAQCDGMPGGNGGTTGGGSGSGGGFQAWIRGTGQALTLNSATRRCNGGVSGAGGNFYGGAGGAGVVLDLQFSDLGF